MIQVTKCYSWGYLAILMCVILVPKWYPWQLATWHSLHGIGVITFSMKINYHMYPYFVILVWNEYPCKWTTWYSFITWYWQNKVFREHKILCIRSLYNYVSSVCHVGIRMLSMNIFYRTSPQCSCRYHNVIHESKLPYVSPLFHAGIIMLSTKINYCRSLHCVMQVSECYPWK